MKALARGYCWWPTIDNDIDYICKNCYDCAINSKVQKKIHHPWEAASKPFERVHIDFAGPFIGTYFLILVDAFSKWPEVHILKNITTETTISVLRKIFHLSGYHWYW